ncbi:MAG: S-layer homology domain-containing protein [Phascolarctobacterium sp.]|nr:S-layer homology domain-containing protein [Phascolarctobacterium sp.]
MKKSLVLAMAMALGVTASAYAANPFSDVPAGHWAYDSISKLAAAGVVEGYPDGSFKGENLMTRYEMAQIVAKAMAKGANVDALAAEFAQELDNLGVRVAALEKKVDNVTITGEVRYLYVSNHGTNRSHENNLRSRLYLAGKVNEDWSYHAMVQNTQDFHNNKGEEGDINWKEAYVDGKLGGLKITAGRYNPLIAQGNVYDEFSEGAEVSYGSKYKLTGFVGKVTEDIFDDVQGEYKALEVNAELGENASLFGGVSQFDLKTGGEKIEDQDVWHAGLNFKFGDFDLTGMYLYGRRDKVDTHGDGFVVNLAYKGAEADEKGSWGIFANYYDQEAETYILHTTDAESFTGEGFKGYGVGVNYAFAKNIIGTVAYYDTESKSTSDKSHKLWTDITFTF